MGKSIRDVWVCDECGFVWLKRDDMVPVTCASQKCRSRKWNVSARDAVVLEQFLHDESVRKLTSGAGVFRAATEEDVIAMVEAMKSPDGMPQMSGLRILNTKPIAASTQTGGCVHIGDGRICAACSGAAPVNLEVGGKAKWYPNDRLAKLNAAKYGKKRNERTDTDGFQAGLD
jgi:hypothetical protein